MVRHGSVPVVCRATRQLPVAFANCGPASWRCGQLTLLEEDDILGSQAKVRVLLEEALRRRARGPAGHDVPRHARRAARQHLEAPDALGLQLEETLVARQANVVAALWRTAAETRALAAGEQQHADVALLDGIEADLTQLGCLGGSGGGGEGGVGRRRGERVAL
jgi:hypothetical protein